MILILLKSLLHSSLVSRPIFNDLDPSKKSTGSLISLSIFNGHEQSTGSFVKAIFNDLDPSKNPTGSLELFIVFQAMCLYIELKCNCQKKSIV